MMATVADLRLHFGNFGTSLLVLVEIQRDVELWLRL